MGWEAHLGEEVASGLWSPEEVVLSVNVRELLAVDHGLRYFAPQITNSTVALFTDCSTAIAYLRNQGGTLSQLLNSIAQHILRWAELLPVVLAPQFIMGRNNVLTYSLSGGSSSDAVPSAGPPSFLGSLRPVGACLMDSRDLSGSGVVSGSLSAGGRGISRSGVPQLDLWSDA